MRNRKGFIVRHIIVMKFVFALAFFITIVMFISNLPVIKQDDIVVNSYTTDITSITTVAQRIHHDLNIYIRLKKDYSVYKPVCFCFEKENIGNDHHAMPYSDDRFIEYVANHFDVNKANFSNITQIEKDKYIVLCARSNGKIYIVNSMNGNVDTSMEPLYDDIVITLYPDGNQNPLILDFSYTGIHEIYKWANSKR